MARWSGSVVSTPEFNAWYASLNERLQDRMVALLRELRDKGPLMGPEGSRRIVGDFGMDLRELRVKTPALRALYTFDPDRNAVMLYGGDKTNEWDRWYPPAIKRAQHIYTAYLAAARRRSGAPR